MARRKYIKGNLRRGDNLRALITDTAPADVPVIFSNDGFYTNAGRFGFYSDVSKKLLEQILYAGSSSKYHSIPYRYRITRDAENTRRLSLPHPTSQIAVCDFYGKFENLICFYNSRSKFSIRAPHKVGSSYFYRNSISNKNKYKNDRVDTLDFDKRVRNPGSYFAYKGHDRLYKFFESPAFARLEKKYPHLWLGDVSKCFDSIYTHTVTWSLKTMERSKTAAKANHHSFGAEFDRLMQRMNYNETNGICIGPEISRVFAETILQRVDELILSRASELGLRHRRDYEVFRYVDDLIIFARDPAIAAKVYSAIEVSLGEFNLHLNDQKLTKFQRPFVTDKSRVVHALKADLSELERLVITRKLHGNRKVVLPQALFRPRSIFRSFLDDVKSTCSRTETQYSSVSNYVVSSLANLIENIIDGHSVEGLDSPPTIDVYLRTIMLLLEICFFFYTVHPTVPISFQLSRAMVVSIQFVKAKLPEHAEFLSEQLSEWVVDLIRSTGEGDRTHPTRKVPIEILNVLMALGELGTDDDIGVNHIARQVFSSDKPDYFLTVSFLYLAGGKAAFSDHIKRVEKILVEHFSKNGDVRVNAHDAHLLLDSLACPYISQKRRIDMLKATYERLGMNNLAKMVGAKTLEEFETRPWFVNWERIDLLSMIRRKELSAVY